MGSVVSSKIKGAVKRRDFGIAGFMIVVSQLLSTLKSSQDISHDLARFKDDLEKSVLEREQFFVRKTEIASVSNKLDLVNEQLIRMNEQLKFLKNVVKQEYSMNEKHHRTVRFSPSGL